MKETIETTSDPGFVLDWYKSHPAVLSHNDFENTVNWRLMEDYTIPS